MKTRENMLFYNLDTPDLIGNKYTHNSLEKSDAAFNGEAGTGVQGCGGLARLHWVLQGTATEQRCSGGCVRMLDYQKAEGEAAFFPYFSPFSSPGAVQSSDAMLGRRCCDTGAEVEVA